MNEIDFDSWPDYNPVSDEQLKPKSLDNENVINLTKDSEVSILGDYTDDFPRIFDNESTIDYYGNEVIRFIKIDQTNIKGENVELFECNEDNFLVRKDNKLYLTYVYQSNGNYFDDNKLTICGWDYNVIINLNKMSCKIKDIR